MKGGRRGKPQLEIYRPGSGPLRKSAQGDEDTYVIDNGRKPKSFLENSHDSSIDDEMKPGKKSTPSVSHEHLNKTGKHFADCNKPITPSGSDKEITKIADKLGNVVISTPSSSNRHRRSSLGHVSLDSSKSSVSDSKKKGKKPEQALYVPKPLAQAIAGRDVCIKSPVDASDSKNSTTFSKDQRSQQMQFENWDEEQLSESSAGDMRMQNSEHWDRSFNRGDSSRRNRKCNKGEKEWLEKEPQQNMERELQNRSPLATADCKYNISLNSGRGDKDHRHLQMHFDSWDGDNTRGSKTSEPCKRSKFDGYRKCKGDKEWLEKDAGNTGLKQSNSNLNTKGNEDKLHSTSQYDLRTIRHLGTYKNNQLSEGDSRGQSDIQVPPWHSESPIQNHQHRRNDPSVSSREIRQASEPRAFPPASLLLDGNRTRDTRSVEPMGNSGRSWAGEKLQTKPPTGRRGSCKDGMIPTNLNKPNQKGQHLSFIAPRFKKKYLAETGQNISVGTPVDDTWDGSTVTFLGTGGMNYQQDHLHPHLSQPHLPQPHLSQPHLPQPLLLHSHSHLAHPHLSHSVPHHLQPPPLLQQQLHLHSQSLHHIQQQQPPQLLQHQQQQFWSHTLPGSRARGRGRLRPEEVEMERMIASATRFSRSLTPDRLSASNVRIPTPPNSSQQNVYQVPGHENLSRPEDQRTILRTVTPPPSLSSSRAREQYQNERKDSINQLDPPPTFSPPPTRYRRRSSSNPREPEVLSNSDVVYSEPPLKTVSTLHQESSSPSISSAPIVASDFTINSDPISADLPRDSPSPKILDWSEEVERSERLEAENRPNESSTMTRSWSMASLQPEKSQGHPPRERRRRRRRCGNKGGSGNTHVEGHEGSGTDDRSVSRDRNFQEQNHDGNRGYSRDQTQNKPSRDGTQHGPNRDNMRGPSKDHVQRGPSKDRNQRGPSRDRNQRGPSKDRNQRGPSNQHGPSRDCNQRGPSRDRNQRGPSKDRNQHGPSKDRNQRGPGRDCNQHGPGRDCNQCGPSKDRNQRGPSRDQAQSDSNRDRTQRDANRDRTQHDANKVRTQRDPNRDRTHRGPSRDRNKRGQSRGLSQERTHSRERSILHERDRDRHKESGRRKHDELERNDRWRETTYDDLERNNRWREEPDRSDRRMESKPEGSDRNEKRRVSKSEMKDRGERRRGSKVDNKGDRRRGSNHEVADRSERWRELKLEKSDLTERRVEPKHADINCHERLHEPESESKGKDSAHKAAPSSHVAGILVLPASDVNTAQHVSMEQQEQTAAFHRQLYDPNNPNKPIIVSAPGARAARENEPSTNGSSTGLISGHPSGYGIQGYPVVPLYPDIPAIPHGMELLNNSRPSWYDPFSSSFMSSHNHHIIVDIERADVQLQWILGSGGIIRDWNRIVTIRQYLQHVLHTLLVTDIKFCQAENVEQYLWKILFYNIIELLRKGVAEDAENKEQYKKILLTIIEEGTTFLENLLEVLEHTYKFKLDTFLSPNSVSLKGLGYVKLALVSAQKIFLFLGDLARYKEQINETSNFGKSRQCYIKAHQINPKNGRPYNQLAILAVYARRKLDAVYYYMRSLMASNPFQSARESLLMLFDESRKKYEQAEKRRREECEAKRRERMKEKEGAGKEGLRREYWVHPGGGRRRLHITTSTAREQRHGMDSEEEELTTLSSVEVNKRFVTSYLNVHGKLFTKIGMETFQEAALQMLREFRALLQHSPVPLNANRFLQLLALNMFAIENTQLKDTQMEPGYRSAVQESALVVSLQMFNLILEKCNSLLREQTDGSNAPPSRLIVSEDMLLLLPAVKVWCDWLLCHSSVWNPPPSCVDYRVGPAGDAWSRLATLVNLLERLEQQKDVLASLEQEGYDLVRLPEDATLSDFTPLMYNSQDPTYTNKETDMEVAQVVLRIHKVVFFGTEFLCGVDPPVLKLQKFDSGFSEYISVVQASSQGSPTLMAEEQSDSELRVESFSEDEGEEGETAGKDSTAASSGAASIPDTEIQSLLHRKEELEQRHQRQERHRQRVQAILRDSVISVEIEVKPHHLVPDTNCFIDHLHQLQQIAQAGSGQQQHHYTLMVPLVVLKELEGLARGGRDRDVIPLPDVTPEHAAMVAECAKTALSFLRSKHPGVRCVTSKGTVLNTSTFTLEEDSEQDERNDDRILATCISLCRTSDKDQNKPGEPRRLYREVVLLTEDRNLRVKALARDVPVREVPDFMQWAGLG